MNAQTEAILLVTSVAAACAMPGVFLYLRKLVLVADAISHVLLLGIVLAYFVTLDLDSPWLMVGAALSGVLTVALVEFLQQSRRVKEDAAIGLVFPALFATGTILASMFFRQTHLDVDAVMLGHAESVTEMTRVQWGQIYLGRLPTLIMFGLAGLGVGLVLLLYKELKICTFDPALAATLGFLPGLVHYGLMTVVSLTTVAAFDAVGPVLVLAFLVVPAATLSLITDRLERVLMGSLLLGVVLAIVGVKLAFFLNTNIAGTVATTMGAVFAVSFLLAPRRGLIAQGLRFRRLRREFDLTLLTIHLYQHEGTAAEDDEANAAGLHRHFHWATRDVERVVNRAKERALVQEAGLLLKLTPAGRDRAQAMLHTQGSG